MSLVRRGSATWHICDLQRGVVAWYICDPAGMLGHGDTLIGLSWDVVSERGDPGFSLAVAVTGVGRRLTLFLVGEVKLADFVLAVVYSFLRQVVCSHLSVRQLTRNMCDLELDRPRMRSSLSVFIPRGGGWNFCPTSRLVVFCHFFLLSLVVWAALAPPIQIETNVNDNPVPISWVIQTRGISAPRMSRHLI